MGRGATIPFFDSGIVIVSMRREGLFVLRPNLVDSIAPKVGRATVDRETLTLTYGEALDETSGPALDAFAVTVEDAARSVSGVSVSGSAVTLTLASAVTAAAEVTVTYTAPETSPIRDEAQNNAASLSSREVRNDTTGAARHARRPHGRSGLGNESASDMGGAERESSHHRLRRAVPDRRQRQLH